MHCGDGPPFSCSLSIWDMYWVSCWKGPAAAYTNSRNFSQEAKHNSGFSYKWLGSWRKSFGVKCWWKPPEPCDGPGTWRPLIFLLGWVNPLDLPAALLEKRCGFLVAFRLSCGPDKLFGQKDPWMVKLVLPILILLAGCRNEARRRPRSVMLLSEEQWRKGGMLTKQWAKELCK